MGAPTLCVPTVSLYEYLHEVPRYDGGASLGISSVNWTIIKRNINLGKRNVCAGNKSFTLETLEYLIFFNSLFNNS